jgi:hypothetical protein
LCVSHSFLICSFQRLFISILFSLDKVQPVVCDGDSIGFPCCGVHNCTEPLVNLKERFCHAHDYLKDECAVTTCSNPHESGFRTCTDAAHRALEVAYFSKGKSLLQLKARLKHARNSHSYDPEPLEELVESDEAMIEATFCDGKAEAGNRTFKAYFGRRRSHNEQLILRTCGVILSRATMYGSEAVSGVNVRFLSKTFVLQSNLASRTLQRLRFLLRNPRQSSLFSTTTADWICIRDLWAILISTIQESPSTSSTSSQSTKLQTHIASYIAIPQLFPSSSKMALGGSTRLFASRVMFG